MPANVTRGTTYLQNGAKFKAPWRMAVHESARTTEPMTGVTIRSPSMWSSGLHSELEFVRKKLGSSTRPRGGALQYEGCSVMGLASLFASEM
jgi:hypothetical protein